MKDEEIMSLLWERNEAAVQSMQEKYDAYCYVIAKNILKNSEDAVECVNDAYHALWQSIPPKRPDNFKAFLAGTVRNISLNRYEHNTAKRRNGEFDVLLSELTDCAACVNVEDEVQGNEVARAVSDFLHREKEDERNVFIRRYWYGDSVKNIAKRFLISESKVKSMLFRTRNKLKIYLQQEVGYERN